MIECIEDSTGILYGMGNQIWVLPSTDDNDSYADILVTSKVSI